MYGRQVQVTQNRARTVRGRVEICETNTNRTGGLPTDHPCIAPADGSPAPGRDINIAQNGQPSAGPTHPSPDRVAMPDSLAGIAREETVTLEDPRKERLDRV